MRGETQKCSEGQFFHPEGGECQDKLPEVVVEAGTMLSFKKHLDSYMGTMGIEGYGPNAGNWD